MYINFPLDMSNFPSAADQKEWYSRSLDADFIQCSN